MRKISNLRDRLRNDGRLTKKVSSDALLHTADLVCNRSDVVNPRFSLENVNREELHKLANFAGKIGFHAGFKKVLFEVEIDQNNTIVHFHGIIEIFYLPPDYLVDAKTPFKLGSAEMSGELVTPEDLAEPKWKTQMSAICLFTENDADKLPSVFLEYRIGPGALITGVVQTLLGTQEGLKILGLEEYNVLEQVPEPKPYNPLKDNQFAPKKPWNSLDPGARDYYEWKENPLDIKWFIPPEYRE